ncbi:RNA 3'-terminal phosphate cyclase [Candidatus Thorarchaeota archaeon]|nr:MAG: RNA 3'-terminal phosphate cyclase [Candidatus Thorarchaeota archaeon]
MIEIDGSYGEGGGQILRTSIALAALTMKPVQISKIRAGRPKPGLKKQHLSGIKLTGELVDASIEGLEVGSTEISFIPNQRRSGSFSIDIGTAGSISLILQAVLPPAVLAPDPVTFRIQGGTDVKWSPPVDYLNNVFSPLLSRLGSIVEIEQKKRGHYPRGGGEVLCRVTPTKELNSLDLIDFGKLSAVAGISHCVRLPAHVAERQASSAEKVIREKFDVEVSIETEAYSKNDDKHLGPGSGIVLWADGTNGTRLGSDQLGDRGVPAERVGTKAAEHLVYEISRGKAIDSYLADMIVPYLAVAKGESKIGISEITSHLTTNLWTIEQILGTSMNLEGTIGEPGLLKIAGN